MKIRRYLTRWLACGVQAGIIAGLLSCGTLLAFRLGRSEPGTFLPHGLDGALILVPAIVALGIFAVSGPVFMAATRGEAILGAIAAFLIAADLLMGLSVLIGESLWVHVLSRTLPLGTIAAILAIPVWLLGLAAGQLTAELGFGRSAGLRSAAGAVPLAVIVSLLAAYWL